MDKLHIVDFETYCPKCKYCSKAEEEDPCADCLTTTAVPNSHKPIQYVEGTSKRVKKSNLSQKSRKKRRV